ncbi:DnaD domain protein [Clostridium oryzae]|uniref:Replication initiation and membrane attachment n=1 Tax=Clostridium oryzae TaxID=1450648 RepID=A0A1V4IR54_9CLOT|nr:DnaD domain protein [Clostridium oryzae]OPJ62284.1 replication initiation and membrane attachment [Clostridium oryzae]
MSTFMFKKSAAQYTLINNLFIEKFMPKARGEFVKVYLMILKLALNGEAGINSTMLASMLHLLESDVMNALNYWNEEGILNFVPIDKLGNYSIEILEISEINSKDSSELNLLEELNNSSIKDMLHEIEKLVGRPLGPKEISTYIGWQKDFNFSPEIILLIIEYCSSKGKNDYRYIEKVAIAWHDANITSVEEAQSFIKKHEDKWVKYKKILNYLGIKDGEIMKPQEDMLNKWVNTFNFQVEIIMKACDICFNRLSRADFKYIDAILSSWNKDGLKTIQDIETKDKSFNYKKNFSKNNKNKQDNFNNFQQRDYDFDSLEKRLLGWDK